ncbi:MAG: general secretion pathway protein GspB [Desulfuromonadales bacterium]|nr:general secretion pathway protein GspB [Desulfuromonadales bacterium]
MSFILEALKKSEQQRQEQNVPLQKKVRNRTLSLTSSRSGHQSYWLLALLLPVLLLGGGWWLYLEINPTLEPIPELSLEKSARSETSLPKEPEPAVANAAPVENDDMQQPVLAAEAAPVPSIYVSAPAVPARRTSTREQELAIEGRRVDVAAATEMMNADEPVATTIIEQSQPVDNLALESGTLQMPRYSDLSRDMRERMSPLAMSMHFYNSEPNRRLVRINDQLLREGDWVSRDLELVEITPSGVILDFLGTTFELLGSKR